MQKIQIHCYQLGTANCSSDFSIPITHTRRSWVRFNIISYEYGSDLVDNIFIYCVLDIQFLYLCVCTIL